MLPDFSGKFTRVWVCNPGSDTMNPAFDVTPAGNITAIITEKGVAYPPYKDNLRKVAENP